MQEQEECDIDPQLVNNMNLARARQSRQLEDQDYHLGTGAIFDTGWGLTTGHLTLI